MVPPPGDTVGQILVEDEVEPSSDVRHDHVAPEPPKKRSRVDAPRKPARKRVASPSRWEVNEAAADLSVENDFLVDDSLLIDGEIEIEDNNNNVFDGIFIFFII
jgi:hypothetical protein